MYGRNLIGAVAPVGTLLFVPFLLSPSVHLSPGTPELNRRGGQPCNCKTGVELVYDCDDVKDAVDNCDEIYRLCGGDLGQFNGICKENNDGLYSCPVEPPPGCGAFQGYWCVDEVCTPTHHAP